MCLEQGALYIVDAGTHQNSSTEAEESAGEGTASFLKSLENFSLKMFFTRRVASGNTLKRYTNPRTAPSYLCNIYAFMKDATMLKKKKCHF